MTSKQGYLDIKRLCIDVGLVGGFGARIIASYADIRGDLYGMPQRP